MSQDNIRVSHLAWDMCQWEVHRLRNDMAAMLLATRSHSDDGLQAEFEMIVDDFRRDQLAALRTPSLRATRPAA